MTTNDPTWEIKEIRIFDGELSPEARAQVMKELQEKHNPEEHLESFAPMFITLLSLIVLACLLMIWLIATTVKEWK